ncbi:MAG: PD-(D/E)XK nuclease family protein [Acidimicrobiales bacterium]
MSLPLPTSLSPSKVSTFKDCALAFRFSAIDKLPEPPSAPAVKGSLVHRALELLFVARPHERTRAFADDCLAAATAEFMTNPEFVGLELDDVATGEFLADAATMLSRYFELEDPTRFDPVGVELMLSANVGDLLLRGIIDRLDLDENGELVVTDYKTGRVPSENQEMSRLGGVHFYAFLCQQVFGRRPAKVQLMYLGASPQIIIATPTEQSINGLEKRVQAIWSAVERACEHDDFRPKQSMLCNWCSFKEYCPAFGGDPEAARLVGQLAGT